MSGVEIKDQGRLNRDPKFRAVAESARRAVEACSPLILPPDKYALWRDIDPELPSRGCDQRLMNGRPRSATRWAWLYCVLVLVAPWPAVAQLELDITEGVIEPLPIAIPEFYGATPGAAARGQEIADVVSADLERSGLFRPIDRRAFIQTPEQLRDLPRFADWRQINAQALVTGEVTGGEDGADLTVEFRLWDVFAGTQMRGLRFATAPDNWRRVAHKIADAVYERITGEAGYFDTRIVYVAESGPATDRVKRLAIMDQDGANHRFLTDGADLVLTPRFHPGAGRVAFMTYGERVPQVYELDLITGAATGLGDFERMTFAPHFAPDGRRVAMSLAEEGNSDIYVLDLVTREQRRLTDHPAIDTSPSFSPDGRRLVFNSDRGGHAPALRHERQRQRGGADQLRHRTLRQPGLVAPRRPDRVHQDPGRPVSHRSHAAGRQRRAAADAQHPRRGPGLGAQWPRHRVQPQGLRVGSDPFVHHRRDRLQ